MDLIHHPMTNKLHDIVGMDNLKSNLYISIRCLLPPEDNVGILVDIDQSENKLHNDNMS